VVARKPLSEPTVAANVLTYGTGAINVDGCRIEAKESTVRPVGKSAYQRADDAVTGGVDGWRALKSEVSGGTSGRWPANVILDEEAGKALDGQSGLQRSGAAIEPKGKPMSRSIYGPTNTLGRECGYGDTGGASRFFYCAKANREERRGGNHPTVKPVALMRYLVRLVTPKGGRVLDPFAGTFKTGEACLIEGFDFTGVELGEANCETGRWRLGRASGEWAEIPRLNRKPFAPAPLFDI
jgi:hypothetical protein